MKILKTKELEEWLLEQRPQIRTQVLARLDLLSLGHFGNHKRFKGLIELRWLNGSRVYSFLRDSNTLVALYGGSKHAQRRDIEKAKKIRRQIVGGARTVRQ